MGSESVSESPWLPLFFVSFLASQQIFWFGLVFKLCINFHHGFPSLLLPVSLPIRHQACVPANFVDCVGIRNQICDN